jgi:hypothetical protein
MVIVPVEIVQVGCVMLIVGIAGSGFTWMVIAAFGLSHPETVCVT